jgi:diguanylate cyclase (GGDEF)-like protein
MKLETKIYEIFLFIVIIAVVLTFIIAPQEHREIQIIAGAVGCITIIIFSSQIYNKRKYNIKSRNYNIKSADDIMVKDIRDSQASRVSVVNTTENDTFDNSSFVVVNLAELDLSSKKSNTSGKQVHTYSGDFDVENSINDDKPNKQNNESQTEIFNDISKQNNNKEIKIDSDILQETETKTPKNITEQNSSIQNISTSNIKSTVVLENKNIEPFQKLDIDLPVNHIIDMDTNLETKRDEFLYFIRQFFIIIRSVLDANTLAFVWVNHSSQMLDFRLLLSGNDTRPSLITKQQVRFGNDIISQIVRDARPQIISKLNTSNVELDYFNYYTKSVGTNSFIGIPVYFENTVIAVLCADSRKINAFSQEDYSFLGCFTKVISSLINTFSSDSKQENAEQILEIIGGFNKLISLKGSSFNEICNSIMEYILKIYSCSSIGIVSYNDIIKNWAVLSYRTIDDVNETFMQEIVSLDTIIGECITRNQTIPVANIPQEFTRVNKYEPNINDGSFIAIPIRSITDVYGALFIEHKDNPHFATTVDLNTLETICEQAGEMLEKIKLMQLYNKYVATEIKTGILTETSLRNRILEEYNKAIDTNSKITFALISLDKYAALEDAHKKSIIFNKIIELVRANIKQYELIGRINSDVLGVILFNRNTNQSKPIFERIRQQLATRYIDIDNEKLAFTISVGLAQLNPKNTFDDFISNATTALKKAKENKNYVQVFE